MSFLCFIRLMILADLVCVILSHPDIYPKVKHIWILRIL